MKVLSLLRPATPLGSGQVVFAFQLDAGDLFDLGEQLVDGDQLARTQVDRRGNQVVAMRDRSMPFDAVVDVHETAGLGAVAPDGDVLLPVSMASMTLRQMAAGAFSRPPSQVPCGP